MKKIALQTKVINNYGSCLQAYALYRTIQQLGYDVDILPFARFGIEPNFFISTIKTFKYFLFKKSYKNEFLLHKMHLYKMFCSFRKDYLNLKTRDLLRNKEYFKNTNNIYDVFVVGSDTLWDPNRRYDNFYYDTLSFTDDSKKRIAYAPSFAISKFPEHLIEEVKPMLSRFQHLSCREDEGVELLQRDFGLASKQVLDPTLLVSKATWEQFMNIKYVTKKKNYVIYAFGDFPTYELIDKLLRETTEDIDIIPLHNCFNKKIYENPRVHMHMDYCGPREFVALISNAKVVFTSGFHAIAFAINFNIPFALTYRDHNDELTSVNSRLRSIIKTFHFEDRMFTNSELLSSNIKELEKQDYHLANEILNEKQQDSINYLKNAIES